MFDFFWAAGHVTSFPATNSRILVDHRHTHTTLMHMHTHKVEYVYTQVEKSFL